MPIPPKEYLMLVALARRSRTTITLTSWTFCPSPLFGADSRVRRHVLATCVHDYKRKHIGPSALRILFLHAAEDAVVVLVAAATGAMVILLVVCHAILALFHLVPAYMDLVTSVALSLARVVARCQGTAGEGALVQVLSGNMGNRRGILRESNRNASRCASAPKTAGEKLDGSSQAIVLLVAADTG